MLLLVSKSKTVKITLFLALICPRFLCCQVMADASSSTLSYKESSKRELLVPSYDLDTILTCPRCRRAQPPGPLRGIDENDGEYEEEPV